MPEKLASIKHHVRTGSYLVFPFGYFRGSGSSTSIHPWCELPSSASAVEIGTLVIRQLEQSRRIDVHRSDAHAWLEKTMDKTTRTIFERYKIDSLSSSKFGKIFQTIGVRLGHRAKSWHVIRYEPDPRYGGITGVLPGVYVRIKEGPEALGRAITALLADDYSASTSVNNRIRKKSPRKKKH